MLLGLVVIAVVATCGLTVQVTRRRQRDEIRSVGHYHERLDTLHVDAQDRGGSVRLVPEVRTTAPPHEPSRPRLDPDAAHLDTSAPAPLPAERPRRHDRAWALSRMQPRARVDTATVVLVVLVVIALLGIGVVGYLIHRGRTPSTPRALTVTSVSGVATSSLGVGDDVVRVTVADATLRFEASPRRPGCPAPAESMAVRTSGALRSDHAARLVLDTTRGASMGLGATPLALSTRATPPRVLVEDLEDRSAERSQLS